MMKKFFIILVTVMLYTYTVTAQTVVKDSVTGSPVAQASVLNEKGLALGQTDMEGRLPDLRGTKSISVSHIGYAVKKVKVAELGKELLLSPVTYPVREVVKEMGKPYCLRLKCYLRKYIINDALVAEDDTLDVPPVLSFTDGIYNLYLYDEESINITKAQPLVTRNVLSNDLLNGKEERFFSMSGMNSYLEKIKNGVEKGKYELRGHTNNQELYRIKKKDKFRTAVIKRDTKNKTITVDVDNLAPKGEWSFDIGFIKAKRVVDTESYLYRMTGYQKVGQYDLLAYQSVTHQKNSGSMDSPTVSIDDWHFVEFYPFEAQFLTHKEYNADKEEMKDCELTVEDIDSVMKTINVPALPLEIEQKLLETRKWLNNHPRESERMIKK